MNPNDEIIKWCESYVKDKRDAAELSRLILHYMHKHDKAIFGIGVVTGLLFGSLLLKWLA